MKNEQYEKLECVVKLIIFYRNFIQDLISKNSTLKSIEWLRKPKYYKLDEGDSFKIVVKVILLEIS